MNRVLEAKINCDESECLLMESLLSAFLPIQMAGWADKNPHCLVRSRHLRGEKLVGSTRIARSRLLKGRVNITIFSFFFRLTICAI